MPSVSSVSSVSSLSPRPLPSIPEAQPSAPSRDVIDSALDNVRRFAESIPARLEQGAAGAVGGALLNPGVSVLAAGVSAMSALSFGPIVALCSLNPYPVQELDVLGLAGVFGSVAVGGAIVSGAALLSWPLVGPVASAAGAVYGFARTPPAR